MKSVRTAAPCKSPRAAGTPHTPRLLPGPDGNSYSVEQVPGAQGEKPQFLKILHLPLPTYNVTPNHASSAFGKEARDLQQPPGAPALGPQAVSRPTQGTALLTTAPDTVRKGGSKAR